MVFISPPIVLTEAEGTEEWGLGPYSALCKVWSRVRRSICQGGYTAEFLGPSPRPGPPISTSPVPFVGHRLLARPVAADVCQTVTTCQRHQTVVRRQRVNRYVPFDARITVETGSCQPVWRSSHRTQTAYVDISSRALHLTPISWWSLLHAHGSGTVVQGSREVTVA